MKGSETEWSNPQMETWTILTFTYFEKKRLMPVINYMAFAIDWRNINSIETS